jgi:hypothetical protein
MSHKKQIEHHVRPYKLLAQAAGLLVCGFFMLFIVGEGIPDIIKGNGEELIPFLPLVLLPIAGYIITWVKEWQGAAVMVAGAIILLVYFLIKGEIKAALIYSIPFLISAALFFLHIKKRSALQHRK